MFTVIDYYYAICHFCSSFNWQIKLIPFDVGFFVEGHHHITENFFAKSEIYPPLALWSISFLSSFVPEQMSEKSKKEKGPQSKYISRYNCNIIRPII